jgi:hypothetical protein
MVFASAAVDLASLAWAADRSGAKASVVASRKRESELMVALQ